MIYWPDTIIQNGLRHPIVLWHFKSQNRIVITGGIVSLLLYTTDFVMYLLSIKFRIWNKSFEMIY